ncbi:unnamed protein product [Didymodactylos carnosus]|uniref:Uncharacterized protein n=1 Tax=Didymodactylos carnosus TaxID=1234261 RepID=A0A814KHI7_9BILA|nr:unnamed protein product [Didymodactylos carnosus]CAF3819177.1 unnamed protein product [Didymodactylos carnosus]
MATEYASNPSTERDRNCHLCSLNFNRTRASLCQCFHCDQNLCLECFTLHKEKLLEKVYNLQDRYNEINEIIKEKRQEIVDSSTFCMDEVLTWFQKSINDLFECQQQIIENIELIRDEAQIKLVKSNELLQPLGKELHLLTQNNSYDTAKVEQITAKLDDTYNTLKHFRLTKEVKMPAIQMFLPKYKISFLTEQKNDTSSNELENWNENTERKEEISFIIPTTMTNQVVERKDTLNKQFVDSQIDVVADNFFDLQWATDSDSNSDSDTDIEQDVETVHDNDEEMDDNFFFDHQLYRLILPRHYDFDIRCLTSNGTNILCYSQTSKKLIYYDDKTNRQLTIDWHHNHLIHLSWLETIETYVALTQDHEIYSIESNNNKRLKIRLRHHLPNRTDLSLPVFMRTDEKYIYYYYEDQRRERHAKYLRLLNLNFQHERVYPLDKRLSANKHIRHGDIGQIVGLAVNYKHIVLLQQHEEQQHNEDEWEDVDEDDCSTSANNYSKQASLLINQYAHNDEMRLLIFDKKNMNFLQRLIIDGYTDKSPVFHYNSPSCYFLIDQRQLILRFFNKNNESGEVKLIPRQLVVTASINAPKTDFLCTSLTLMNDGTLLITNDTPDVIQLSIGEIDI